MSYTLTRSANDLYMVSAGTHLPASMGNDDADSLTSSPKEEYKSTMIDIHHESGAMIHCIVGITGNCIGLIALVDRLSGCEFAVRSYQDNRKFSPIVTTAASSASDMASQKLGDADTDCRVIMVTSPYSGTRCRSQAALVGL